MPRRLRIVIVRQMGDKLASGQSKSVSINTRLDISGFMDRKSSLTSPLLNEYEIVRSEDHTEMILQSYDNTSGVTSVSMTTQSVASQQFEDESSSARKLADVCSAYQEAAIYLREGEENEKLYHHPSSVTSYWAYMVLHNPVYYIAEFAVSVLLMLLAFLEKPTFLDIPVRIAPVLELVFLFCLSVDIALKLLWIKPKFAFKHYRTIFKCILWIVMFTEAIVVLGRNEPHVRMTRALRPLFVLDSNLSVGVRRILRQIFQCLGPIIDVLCLLFFFIAIFAISGYYLFATESVTNFQFSSLRESFVSMYIAATTANFPDVMMESYKRKPLAPLFFIIFLIITLYIITNVLLAVVYSTFQNIQKKKFRALYLHRRNAIRHVFHVLAVRGTKHKVLPLSSYFEMMKCYSKYTSKLNGLCTFKAMKMKVKDIDDTVDRATQLEESEEVDNGEDDSYNSDYDDSRDATSLRIEEFYAFYDIQRLSWTKVSGYGELLRWYIDLPDFLYSKMKKLTKAVKSTYFKAAMNLIFLSNLLFFFIVTSHVSDPDKRFDKSQEALIINFVFISVYLGEIILKLVALGPIHYFRSYWNVFDFIVITASLIIQLIEIESPALAFVLPLRFFRLIRFNKRLRAIFNTLAVLTPRIISIVILLILVYYFYAIIGMEIFSGDVYEGCCNTSSGVQDYYTGNGSNVYYLNNFDSISQSYVTLFEAMVINNWWILMEGFHAHNKHSRLFFIIFHLTTSIVLTVAIAFIVEAFVLKIDLARQEASKHADVNVSDQYNINERYAERHQVPVSERELKRIEKGQVKSLWFSPPFPPPYWPWELPPAFRKRVTRDIPLEFAGSRRRTKEDVQKQLYEDQLEQWIADDVKIEKSPNYSYNQLPTKSSLGLLQRLKDKITGFIVYVFD
ncbi:two pore channel protein 1-like isoform X2 [Dysidea avara]|uniref:two pore channel protein 1-like isoform X2 n=1 Tax=Dysidea avara TaxID=196820 RepID=UPI00332E2159